MTGIPSRLFVTCWLIYSIHFATNTVREIYLALSIGGHATFRVDKYAGLHPDLFETPGRGWHINNNPGASMLAAIPWAVAAPIAERLADRARAAREKANAQPPVYDSPWPMAREFHRQSWLRGLDLEFGVASIVTQMACMAPVSALGVVVLHDLLRRRYPPRTALALALLYAFGTPVFYRAGYLNQNMLAGHLALFGFYALEAGVTKTRVAIAGIVAGACVLMDYSGVMILAGLAIWALIRRAPLSFLRNTRTTEPVAARISACSSTVGAAAPRPFALAPWYALGAALPLSLLAFYQYASFGHPVYPAQHWMPATVAGNTVGYHGVSLPEPALLWESLFDLRYGLFTTAPIFVAAVFARRSRESIFVAGLCVASWLFFASIYYSRLQFNTGIRYMALLFPFLFLAVADVLNKLPRRVAIATGAASVAYAWSMAMYRDMERGWGVLEPVLNVVRHGPQLPALIVLQRTGNTYGEWVQTVLSPWPVFATAAMILWLVWRRAEI